MGAVVSYTSLEHVAARARPYPTRVLEGCETGLVLFCAAFLGHNDAIHFAEAGIETTCVDLDAERLEEMADLYPSGWIWEHGWDAWEYARSVGANQWDVVSLDPFTCHMQGCLDDLDLWCSLARKAVVVGTKLSMTSSYTTPEGWSGSLHHRANDVYWLALERA